MSQGDFLGWLNEDYGDRYVQRKLEAEAAGRLRVPGTGIDGHPLPGGAADGLD